MALEWWFLVTSDTCKNTIGKQNMKWYQIEVMPVAYFCDGMESFWRS